MKRGNYFDWDAERPDGRTNLRYAIEMYKRGHEPEDIAREFGISRKAVLSKLTRSQTLAPRAAKRTPTDTAAAAVPAVPNVAHILRENERLRESERRARDYTESIVASLSAIAQAIPATNPIPKATHPPASHHRPHVVVAPVSDMQIGTFIDPRDVAGLGGANFGEFKRKMAKYVDTLILLTNLHRNNYQVDVLEIPFLGDNVEGEGIFPSQAHFLDLPTIDQVLEGAHVVAWALRAMVEDGGFKKVRTRWVAGNHGRPGRKGEGHPGTNFDTIFAHYVRLLCANIPQIEFYIADRASSFMAYEIPEVPDFKWLIAHGDQVKGSMSIPYYGLDRAHARWTELTGLPLDYILIGHHHRSAQISGVRGQMIVNGNWIGATDLTINRMVTAGDAKQLMMVVHPEVGVVASHDIYLSRLPRLSADENGIYTSYNTGFAPIAAVR